MVIDKLYKDLMEAYSDKNLNRITGKLIELYKNKNHATIREIANRISHYVSIDEENDAKCFSKLIMLYHPDRAELFFKNINSLYANNDKDGLTKYAHILLIDDIGTIKVVSEDYDIDYHPEYMWDDIREEDYNIVDSDSREYNEEFDPEEIEKSFYNAIKMREFGHLNATIPTWYLEDFDEFEMAYSGLDSLDGVEYCKHVIILNVSNNEISDISNLWNLRQLEELYLGNNQITEVDTLSNLLKLRVIDLSGNQINDITPLLELENLEYLNLVGNEIPKHQLEELKLKDILVMI